MFLAAFRHPWPIAADHAAEALVALEDRDAIKPLEKLLDQPDPRSMYKEDGKWKQKELVRVNHLASCLLCHPPSTSPTDSVRGFIPRPGEPLPVEYYESRAKGDFVRADITFIQQDFSVLHQVTKPDKWPEVQRFDYFVRTRILTEKEVETQRANPAEKKGSYPQRDAVLYALGELKKLAPRAKE